MPATEEAARSLREGAERLRQIAASEGDSALGREMRRIADEMEENAAHLEASAPAPKRPPTA